MLKKIDNLIYKLELPEIIYIHLIISITQLKFISDRFEDFYHRIILSSLSIAKNDFETLNSKFVFKYRSYKIDKLIDRKETKRNIKYLIH